MSLTIHYRRFTTHHVSGIRNLATAAQPRLGRNAPNGLKLSATQLLNDKIWGIGNALATAIEEPDGKDATSMGHIALAQQRQMLHYMRLIENEMPQLVGTSPASLSFFRSTESHFSQLIESPSYHHHLPTHLLCALSHTEVKSTLLP